jgi:hypothetical protein
MRICQVPAVASVAARISSAAFAAAADRGA